MKLRFVYPDINQFEIFLATKQYEDIWKTDAPKIIQAFEKITNLTFQQQQITVKVHNKNSVSGSSYRPMRLNVYNKTIDEKRAALLHELGHRLLGGNGINSTLGRGVEFIEDEERRLGLFILDVYKRVYGSNFVRLYISRTADLVMKGEAGHDQSMSNGIFFARKFTAAQRQEALKHLIATNKFELRRRKSSMLVH